jgi:hypothetical protein
MLDIACSRCAGSLEEPGGLAFSPPNAEQQCRKYHFCKTCWFELGIWASSPTLMDTEQKYKMLAGATKLLAQACRMAIKDKSLKIVSDQIVYNAEHALKVVAGKEAA